MRSYRSTSRIIFTLILLSVLCLPLAAFTQDKEQVWAEGARLFKDGQQLYYNRLFSKSKEAFEEALKSFEAIGEKKSMAATLSNLGNVHRYLGEYKKAIVYYKRSRDVYRREGDQRGVAACLLNLGIVSTLQGTHDSALSYFRRALEFYRELEDKENQALVLFNMGAALSNRENYPEALSSYRQCLELRKELRDIQGESECYLNMGLVYTRKGEYEQALQYLEQALSIKRRRGDKRGEAAAHTYLGVVYSNQGDLRRGAAKYEQALSINRELKDKKSQAASLVDLAIMHANQGDFGQAVALYRQALPLREELEDRHGMGVCYAEAGYAHASLGEYARALESYDEALRIKKDGGDKKGEGLVLNYTGDVYTALGDDEKALLNYQQALKAQQETGDKRGEVTSLTNIGNVFFYRRDYQAALPYYQRAWVLRQELGDYSDYYYHGDWIQDLSHYHWKNSYALEREFGDRLGLAKDLNLLGEIYKNQGDYFQSLAYFDKARAFFYRLGVPFGFTGDNLGDTYLSLDLPDRALEIFKMQDNPINLGRYYLFQKDYETAKKQFLRRQDKFAQLRMDDFVLAGWIGLGLAAEGMSNYEEAKIYFQRAVEALEREYETLPAVSRRNFLRGEAVHIPRAEAYEGLIRVLARLNEGEKAFQYSETLRGRRLAEQITGRPHAGYFRLPKHVAEKERDLIKRTACNYQQQKTALRKGNAAVLEELTREGAAIEKEQQTFLDQLRREHPHYAALCYPRPVLRENLPLKQKEVLIEYEVTGPYTIGFVISDKKLEKTFFVPETRRELEQLAAKLRNSVGSDKNFDCHVAHRLYNLLLKEALASIPREYPLIIVPDETLSLIPFAALVTNRVEAPEAPENGSAPPAEASLFSDGDGRGEGVVTYRVFEAFTLCRVLLDGRERTSFTIKRSRQELEKLVSGLYLGGEGQLSFRERERREGEFYRLVLANALESIPGASPMIVPDGILNLAPLERLVLRYGPRRLVSGGRPFLLQAAGGNKAFSYFEPREREEVFIEYEISEAYTICSVFKGDKLVKTVTIPRNREEMKALVRRIRPLVARWREEGKTDMALARQLYDLFLKEALAGIAPGAPLVIIPDKTLHYIPFESLVSSFFAESRDLGAPGGVQESRSRPPAAETKRPVAMKDEVVVEYKTEMGHTVCSVEREGALLKTITIAKSRAELEQLIERAGESEKGEAVRMEVGLAYELYNIFLKNALADIPRGSPVIIILDEFLSRLPFEELVQRFAWKKPPAELLDADKNVTIEYEVRDEAVLCTVDWEGDIQKTVRIEKSRRQLSRLIAEFPSPLDPGDYAAKFSTALKEKLFDLFLREALTDIPPERGVIVIADRFLSLVPFDALLKNFRRGEKDSRAPRYVGDFWPVSYHPSATRLALSRRVRAERSSPRHLLIMADPVYKKDDPRVKHNEHLVHERGVYLSSLDLAGILAEKKLNYALRRLASAEETALEVRESFSQKVTLLEGIQCAEEKLKSQALNQYRYLSFHTHTILGRDLPYVQEPNLVLTLSGDSKEDGFLAASEIFNLRLDAEVVALAAGQTSQNLAAASSGAADLSQAFFYAGSDTVVLGLWPLDDEGALLFWERFWQYIEAGKEKLAALRQAQAHLRGQGYENPYYWAPFILLGETD